MASADNARDQKDGHIMWKGEQDLLHDNSFPRRADCNMYVPARGSMFVFLYSRL